MKRAIFLPIFLICAAVCPVACAWNADAPCGFDPGGLAALDAALRKPVEESPIPCVVALIDRPGLGEHYFTAGAGFRHSTGFAILGLAVERAAGQPLEEILHSRLFRPPGMTGTSFFIPAEKSSRVARIFRRDARAETWKDALELVVGRWVRFRKERLVPALDEFQWMVQASPELPSVIQELWDREWSGSGRILPILCGSYIGFMEREVLGRASPLFSRRTAKIHLRPFDHLEAEAFHPGYPDAAKAAVHGICGGVPFYLSAWRSHRGGQPRPSRLRCSAIIVPYHARWESRRLERCRAAHGSAPGPRERHSVSRL